MSVEFVAPLTTPLQNCNHKDDIKLTDNVAYNELTDKSNASRVKRRKVEEQQETQSKTHDLIIQKFIEDIHTQKIKCDLVNTEVPCKEYWTVFCSRYKHDLHLHLQNYKYKFEKDLPKIADDKNICPYFSKRKKNKQNYFTIKQDSSSSLIHEDLKSEQASEFEYKYKLFHEEHQNEVHEEHQNEVHEEHQNEVQTQLNVRQEVAMWKKRSQRLIRGSRVVINELALLIKGEGDEPGDAPDLHEHGWGSEKKVAKSGPWKVDPIKNSDYKTYTKKEVTIKYYLDWSIMVILCFLRLGYDIDIGVTKQDPSARLGQKDPSNGTKKRMYALFQVEGKSAAQKIETDLQAYVNKLKCDGFTNKLTVAGCGVHEAMNTIYLVFWMKDEVTS